ncbi:hypothetical protein D3C77_445500 [compost metagenome]
MNVVDFSLGLFHFRLQLLLTARIIRFNRCAVSFLVCVQRTVIILILELDIPFLDHFRQLRHRLAALNPRLDVLHLKRLVLISLAKRLRIAVHCHIEAAVLHVFVAVRHRLCNALLVTKQLEVQLVLQLARRVLRFAVCLERFRIVARGSIFVAFLLILGHLHDRIGKLGRLPGFRIPDATPGNRHRKQHDRNSHDPFLAVLRLLRKRLIRKYRSCGIIAHRLPLLAEDDVLQRIRQAVGITRFRQCIEHFRQLNLFPNSRCREQEHISIRERCFV